MKCWLLFAGVHYYPSAGLGDYVGSYETETQARSIAEEMGIDNDWYILAYIEEDGWLTTKRHFHPWLEMEEGAKVQ